MSKDSWIRGVVIWFAIIALFVLSFKFLYREQEVAQVKYADFVAAIERPVEDPKRMLEVSLRGDTLRGDNFVATLKDNSKISTFAPYDETLRQELRTKLSAQNIPLSYERPDEGGMFWTGLLTMWLPLILIVVFMFLFLRNMQGAGGKALSFGKSKAKLLPENSQRVTFKDVAGVDEAKEECSEIIAFLKDHKRFQEIGARIPKGVLMMGSPGTGKTLLARAIAGEAGVPFFHISGSDFVEMFVGVGASRVRDLFENAKKNAPCIVFIDEIDAVGRHRGAGVGGGHDEREQTLNQLLVEMDGFEANDAVICIAATNRPDVLDPALLRPGRFDRRVVVNLPDVKGRKAILDVYINKVKTMPDINLDKLALGTPGFAGADLENLVNEAALMAARMGAKKISMADFESAKDKILMGPERKSMALSKENITITAYHEAGHALVAHYTGSKSKVHKVTVIPRGQALGVTAFLPIEDIYSHSRSDLLNDIAKAMGGRAAEDIKFGQYTTGAANDIKQATEMARAMVCRYGMSRLGPINFGQKSENPFLGRDFGESRNFSDSIAHEIDNEVSSIINSQYEKAKQILLDHMKTFEHVASLLVELETLDAEEFMAAVGGSDAEAIRRMQAAKIENRTNTDSREPRSPAEGGADAGAGPLSGELTAPSPA